MDHLDPDWELAALHGQSSKAGKLHENISRQDLLACKCCFNIVHKDPIPICENAKELEFLGFGFPLFYSFMKDCIILLIILISSYSII